ncbi:hypothetical protein ABT337_25490 [Saccharopolyspora hirsuta]|uniref:Uncharacterized protein n=1 Tax=Saccharopolyspora hirsuta TaxID=1837 RepID=A0A5M7BJZ3_SACHI|nr:hypothetical protein [Saccharopolyspora hirsuta]KAA5829170.1 hypothetical protein F1721_26245 [Saccharopolyspora hirsuta]
MAGEISVPEDLKQRFARLKLAEDDIREALFIWHGLDGALRAAAGNDQETSAEIKKKADVVNPAISDLLDALGAAFGINSEKGKSAHDKFTEADNYNADLVSQWGNSLEGGGSASGGGKH